MEQKPTTVVVEIGDRPYTLKAGDDPQYVRKVAQYVDQKLREMTKLAPSLQPTQLAVLTAINIADEMFQRSGPDPRLLGTIKARIEALIEKIPA